MSSVGKVLFKPLLLCLTYAQAMFETIQENAIIYRIKGFSSELLLMTFSTPACVAGEREEEFF